ncbi:MAG: type II secretion system F family protein [Candidatus Aminicenantes bacterium]|nr:type II secretion system F family protein [Candidatus Aminicenantes bacterium]
MSYFKCIFVNEKGNFTERIIFSDGKKELKDSYQNADDKLLTIRKLHFHKVSIFKFFSKKISYSEFLLFNQKLITLLRSGVSFIKALEIIIQNSKEGNLKEVLIKIETDIKNGIQISDAFSSNLLPFQKIYRASLMAGEKSGGLESILEKFNIYLEKITTLRRKTLSSLSYPIILLGFMIAMVLIILMYAIPKFSSFYESFDSQLPNTTLILIAVAEFLKNNFLFIIFAGSIIYFIIKLIEKQSERIIIIDYIKLKIPFVGSIILENALAVFSRTLSVLISGGIPVPEAVSIAVETFSNHYFFQQIKIIPEKIKGGQLLSDVMEEVNFIPSMMTEVIRVGESSGNLIDVLDKNAEYYENSIDIKINSIVSLIEPVLIIILGLVVAFMLLSVYLPIFQSIRVVH